MMEDGLRDFGGDGRIVELDQTHSTTFQRFRVVIPSAMIWYRVKGSSSYLEMLI